MVTTTKNRYTPIDLSKTSRYTPISDSTNLTKFSSPEPINLAGLPYMEGKGATTNAGIAYNTVVGLPKAAVDMAKWTGQGIARTVAGVGTTAGNLPAQIQNKLEEKMPITGTKTELPFDQQIPTSGSKIGETLFGGQPINTIQKTASNVQEFLKPYVGEKPAGIASYPLVGLGIALDLSGFGGSKAVKTLAAGEVPEAFFKFMAKEMDPVVIENTLKKIGLDATRAKAIAPELAKTTTAQEAKDVVLAFENNKPTIIPQIEAPSKPIVEPPKLAIRPIQQQILESRKQQALLEAEQATTELPQEFPTQAKEVRDVTAQTDLGQRIPTYTDIGNTKKQLRDLTRNTMEVFGEDFKIIDQSIIEPFNQAKGANIETLSRELDDLKKNIVDKFGFQRGSPESASIQLLGEKKISLAELEAKYGPEKSAKIIEAEKWFKNKYDQYLDSLNTVEQQIYPNTPYKWTPKRVDYFRHYHELSSDFSRLQNILENPIRIDPMLSGISEGTAPKSKWASFKQMRGGNKTKEDAIGGFLDYLPSWSHAVNIDPHIGKFRELADVLARGTQKTKNLNNYIYNLRMFANELSGKSAEWDRIVTESIPGGRTTLQAVNWLNNRVKANTILFNVSSSIAQIYNVPQGLASAGPVNSSKGLAKTLGQIFTKNEPMSKSNFLKERYFKGFQEFDKGILNNTKKLGTWMVTVLDEAGTKFIWNGQYEKALQEGAVNPIKYADDATKLLVAGRGIGEKPLLQNSKVFQILAPFQLELTNLWWVMEDLAKSDKSIMKKFGQFATLFTSLYLLNDGTEKLTGNRLALDPIQMTLDGIQILNNEPTPTGALKTGGRVAGEFLSNIPFGQTLASMYPEYGTTVAGIKVPTRKQLFGREDPTRYGSGLLSTKALTDPLFKIFPPFGGSQLKKTIQGVSAVSAGKSTNVSGDWQYKIAPTGANFLRASLFGKSGTPESQAYYAKQTAPKKTNTSANRYTPI